MRIFRSSLVALMVAATVVHTYAEDNAQIHMIYMGGEDCPPCVAWRKTELPKLEQMVAFKAIRFSYVRKTIKSTVPPRLFLPDEVKPYKEILDEAGNGIGGSAQVAILVDGRVYDYYFGSDRKAEDVERMLLAIQHRSTYPYRRCLKARTFRKCEIDA